MIEARLKGDGRFFCVYVGMNDFVPKCWNGRQVGSKFERPLFIDWIIKIGLKFDNNAICNLTYFYGLLCVIKH